MRQNEPHLSAFAKIQVRAVGVEKPGDVLVGLRNALPTKSHSAG